MTETPGWRGRRWAEIVVVCGLMTLAAVLRFVDLTGESLWYDEAYTVWSARMPEAGSLRMLWDWRVTFPVYYWILHNWIELFGAGPMAVRAMNATAGVLAILPMYAWSKALFGKHTALLAALLLALNPWHVWYSQEVRMYAWAMLGTLCSLLCFARVIRDGRRRWWLAYVACLGLSMHLHYYVGWVMVAHNVYYLWHLLRSGSFRSWRKAWRASRVWIVSQLAIALMAMPALVVFWWKFTHSQWDWLSQRYAAPGLGDLADQFAAYTLGGTYEGPTSLRWACVGLGALSVLWAIARAFVDHDAELSAGLIEAAVVLAIPLGAVFVIGQFASVWVPRYLVLFVPAWLGLVARGLDAMPWRIVTAAALALLIVGQGLSLSGMYGTQQKEDWRGVVAHLEAHAGEGDLLVLMDEECRVPFDYYGQGLFPGRRVEVGRFSEEPVLDAAADEIVSLRGNGRVWLVVSHADGSGLQQRLDASPELDASAAPEFVGIELVAYDSR